MLLQIQIMLVVPGLLYQVAAVGCGVDQDVVRSRLKSALDHSFKIFILYLEILERQVVHVDDEPVVPVLYTGDHGSEILELMLVDLDHPEALIIVLVYQGLDGCGLSGSCVSEEEAVICAAAVYEGFRIVS